MRLIRKIYLFLIVLSFLFFHPNSIQAKTLIFYDDFSSLDRTRWVVFNENKGQITLKQDGIYLSSNSDQFPFFYNSVPLEVDKFDRVTIEIKLEYTRATPWGTGISLTRKPKPNAYTLAQLQADLPYHKNYTIWQDTTNNFLIHRRVCYICDPGTQPLVRLLVKSIDLKPHVWKIVYEKGHQQIFLDNTLVAEEFLDFVQPPTYFNVGNPRKVGNPLPWNDLHVFYIKVTGEYTSPSPLVFIPGLGASWNRDVFLGKSGGVWKMTPFVRVYDDFLDTLEASGYKRGKNLFVWNYDWRQPINDITDDFKVFVDTDVTPKIGTGSYMIAGHSLGGLVGRSYLQKYNDPRVDKVITIGSPHKGATRAYLVWAGGKLWDKTSWASLAVELYIYLNKARYGERLNVIRSLAPVLKDLIPTYDFLVDANNQIIQSGVKNSFLDDLNRYFNLNNLVSLWSKTNTKPTLDKLVIGGRADYWEKINGYWPDGKVINYINSFNGDGTVLVKSASFGGRVVEINNQDHLSMMWSDEGVGKILNQIGVQANSIVHNNYPPTRSQALILFAHSPVKIQVIDQNGSVFGYQGNNTNVFYSPNDKLLVIPNANPNSIYTVKLIGTGNGDYVLDAGWSLNNGNIVWNSKEGKIKNNQVIEYQVKYTNDELVVNNKSGITKEDELLHLINQIEKEDGIVKNRRLRVYLRLAKRYVRLAKRYKNNNRRYVIYMRSVKRWLTLFESRMILTSNRLSDKQLLIINFYLLKTDRILEAVNNSYGFYQTRRGWDKRLAKRNQKLLQEIKNKLKPTSRYYVRYRVWLIDKDLAQVKQTDPNYVYKNYYYYFLLRVLRRQI